MRDIGDLKGIFGLSKLNQRGRELSTLPEKLFQPLGLGSGLGVRHED